MFDCIVIGAGPGGLTCTKELLEQGIENVVCLEQAAALGGTFANTYDNLILTSSATISMFSDFWIGDGNQHSFWTKTEALDYWHRYAEHFGVLDHIRFNAKVISIMPKFTASQDNEKGGERDNESWEVQLESGDVLLTKRIALAIGNNAIPNYPDWKDSLTNVEYAHSKAYRNANSFVGKKVLVVGGGESASDVALEASRVANDCWVSLRNTTGWVAPRRRGDNAADISTHRGVWGLPRDFGAALSEAIYQAELSQQDPVHDMVVVLNKKNKTQKGVWGTYGTKTFALPKAIVHHGCKVVGGIAAVEDGGKTLTTADGEVLKNIDVVVFCTGYKNRVHFLPEDLKETDPRSLYKHMFHPAYQDKIVWIGWARPGFGSQFPIMEMQSRLFASICKGERSLPTATEMSQVAAVDSSNNLEQFEHNAQRVRSLVDYHHYLDDIAGLIGCQPPLWKYFFLHPQIWLRMVYGATQSTQFRLKGPGNKESLAQEMLLKLPVSRLTHIVKAGLKGRVKYAFKGLVPGTNFLRTNSLKTKKTPQASSNETVSTV